MANYTHIAWPPEPSPQERMSIPHQVLRYLNGEEFVYGLLKQHQTSPLKSWLENPAYSEL